jgi:hypothetical protein
LIGSTLIRRREIEHVPTPGSVNAARFDVEAAPFWRNVYERTAAVIVLA